METEQEERQDLLVGEEKTAEAAEDEEHAEVPEGILQMRTQRREASGSRMG